MTTTRIEIPANQIEHEFGVALVEAARALFSHVGQDFSADTRERLRQARDRGAALEIRVQVRPTAVITCIVEEVDGTPWSLFDLVPQPIAPAAPLQ